MKIKRPMPELVLLHDGGYRQTERWMPRERGLGLMMLAIVIGLLLRSLLFGVPIHPPLIPILVVLTLIGAILFFYKKEISISRESNYVRLKRELLVTYRKKEYKLSDFRMVRVKDYSVSSNAGAGALTGGGRHSRVALIWNNYRTGQVVVQDGLVGFVMCDVHRKRGDSEQDKKIAAGLDDAMIYAKKLGEATGLPVVDERQPT